MHAIQIATQTFLEELINYLKAIQTPGCGIANKKHWYRCQKGSQRDSKNNPLLLTPKPLPTIKSISHHHF